MNGGRNVDGTGYRGFVQPGHRLVEALFPGAPPAGEGASAERLAAVLTAAGERFVYDPIPGRTGFDRLLATAPASRPARLNCIDMACVVVSYLRQIGFSERRAWVALAGRTNALAASHGVDFHAWVLVLLDDGPRWVDPATLRAEAPGASEILARHRIYALFNDRHTRVLEGSKRRLIEGRDAAGGLRLYLFGRATGAARGVLDDPAFRDLVARLLASPDGAAAEPGGVDPETLAGWRAAGLVAPRGGRLAAGPRLVPVPRRAEAELAAALDGLMDRYLGLVSAELPALRAAVEATAAGRAWGWPRLAHAVVLGMLVDLAVGRRLDVEALAGGGGSATVWAFEAAPTHHAVGVSWSESSDGRWGLGQLWHREVPRRPVPAGPRMVDQLGRAALGQPLAATAESLYLRHAGLLRRRGPGLEPAVPAFLPADAAALSERLGAAAERAIAEVVSPALARAATLVWWRETGPGPARGSALVRLILDYVTERVFDAGLVPFPAEAAGDEAWGRWLWLGEPGDALPRSRTARDAAAARERVG